MGKGEDGEAMKENILYFIVMPFILLIIIAVPVLLFMGYDFKNVIKGLDVSALIRETKQEENSTTVALKKYEALQQELQNKDKQILDLQSRLTEQQEKLTSLQTIVPKEAVPEEGEVAEEDNSSFKKLAMVYREMSPGSAAQIMDKFSVRDCAAILSLMNTAQQAEILAKMDPQKAADISVSLKERVEQE